MGVSETICATLAILRQFKLMQGKTKSSAAKSTRVPQSRLMRRNVNVCGAMQGSPRQINLVQAKTKSSREKQGSLRRFNRMHGKTRFSAAKSTRLPQSRLLCRKVN